MGSLTARVRYEADMITEDMLVSLKQKIRKTLPGLTSFNFFCDIWMVGSDFGVNKSMDPSYLGSVV